MLSIFLLSSLFLLLFGYLLDLHSFPTRRSSDLPPSPDQMRQQPIGGVSPNLYRALAFADGKEDRKSTRLNSSHANISYAVFCLKKKKDATSGIVDIFHVIDKADADTCKNISKDV